MFSTARATASIRDSVNVSRIDECRGGPLFLTKSGYVVAVGVEQLRPIGSKPPSNGVKRLVFLTTAGAGKLA